MRNLFWFHAFNRPGGAREVLDVLVNGPKPTTHAVSSKTQANEKLLRLTPSAYAYLGCSSELFGTNGIVFEQAHIPSDAYLSPFDTGGLVSHIAPVRHWSDDEKSTYAHSHSWSASSQAGLLSAYPGTKQSGLRSYLNGRCPRHKGPHCIWDSTKAADIWTPVNQWPAWTWELRSSSGLPSGFALKKWASPPNVFGEIVELAAHDASNGALYEHLVQAYVPGGVSQLLSTLRAIQEQP